MSHNFKSLACMIIALFTLSACAPAVGGTDYKASQAQGVAQVQYGTVTSINKVKINNDGSTGEVLGSVGGAVVGGIIGNMFGGGKGNTLATIGGALAGASIGTAGGKAMQNQQGYQIGIQLDNGQNVAVVQGTDITFQIGQRVQLLTQGTSAHVTPL